MLSPGPLTRLTVSKHTVKHEPWHGPSVELLDIPPYVIPLIKRCVEKDPEQRWSDQNAIKREVVSLLLAHCR